MSSYFVKETFFRPDEVVARESSNLPASIHNRLRLLLKRSDGASVFVPIRVMQYLAVVESSEIVFVDAQGGYAYHDGQGGRLIRLAWRPSVDRESLDAPVPCEMVYYYGDLRAVQRRLLAEMGPALDRLLDKQRGQAIGEWQGRVVPFRRSPASG
ncbi:hypothetical protein [Thiocystis violacea]|uniref:hypothetical protein n=1 Tax=Thiocystis violacea TaxID=13725 RepID=UPI00190749E9|nr:hypothetical protein [Thiocystis violacea]MBK1723643.1 hypothetical protein [Thiocystis violacea]